MENLGAGPWVPNPRLMRCKATAGRNCLPCQSTGASAESRADSQLSTTSIAPPGNGPEGTALANSTLFVTQTPKDLWCLVEGYIRCTSMVLLAARCVARSPWCVGVSYLRPLLYRRCRHRRQPSGVATSQKRSIAASTNTVHLTILIRLAKSIWRVRWRLRGRRG